MFSVSKLQYLEDPNSNTSDSLGKLKWTHEAILFLITLYKQHLNDFASTTERNDKVWNRISLELIANGYMYTSTQCKFKFKYLKSKYMQKKDNMKSTSSGQARIKFLYFDAMDDIFGKKPNVTPISLASSLSKHTLGTGECSNEQFDMLEAETINDEEIENIEPIKSKKKKKITAKNNIEKVLSEIRENSSAREAAKQKRHEENMQFKNKMLEVFNEKLDAMIDALKK